MAAIAARPSLRERMADPEAFLTIVELVPWRGVLDDDLGRRARTAAESLAGDPAIDAISITDNAGGHAMASPDVLGHEIAARGSEAIVHVACRDRNRNELLSIGWRLASEGLNNLLVLSGDYPTEGYHGLARPVFDIDSVVLLQMYSEVARGQSPIEDVRGHGGAASDPGCRPLPLFLGAVVSPFKRFERELVPQYQKLELKIRSGAEFIIGQVGYDARRQAELLRWMTLRDMERPVLSNIYLLTRTVARIFHDGKIPGVSLTDELLELCDKQGGSPDKGKAFFREFAAKQVAIARGLGCAGAYLGGITRAEDVGVIIDIADSFGPDDWHAFASEIQFSPADQFALLEADPETGLPTDRLDPAYARSLEPTSRRAARRHVPWTYKVNRLAHDAVFDPDAVLYPAAGRFYSAAERWRLGWPLHVFEQAVKIPLYDCRDCGDCSLADVAYLCPESHCSKNQRNGPCGGSHDGRCEVAGKSCVWAQAYARLKPYGEEDAILQRPVVVADNALRRTSAWANTFLGRDHAADDGAAAS